MDTCAENFSHLRDVKCSNRGKKCPVQISKGMSQYTHLGVTSYCVVCLHSSAFQIDNGGLTASEERIIDLMHT